MDNQVQILIQSYDGKTIIKKVSRYIKIRDLIKQLNYCENNNYMIHNGKRLNNNKTIKEFNVENDDILFLNSKIKGGVMSIILAAGIAVMGFFIAFLILLEDLIVIFVKIIEIIPLLFNPTRFVNDLIFGVSFGIKSLISGMMSSVDSGTSPNKPKSPPGSIPTVCIPPTLMNLILLIVCPPLALFLDRGVTGLFLVIVCAILTVKLYYFPGLIFAALHILC
jgi:uncharacterized membrane protein YqaE (UPF0057 family)